jgi:transcriptional regulator with XRE-family HTH domain
VSRRKTMSVITAEDPSRGRKPGQADTQLGVRIRLAELAGRIGISCQQLQKYEVATNRVTVSRLIDISDALGLDVTKLLSDSVLDPVPDVNSLQKVEMVRLIQSFCGIRNPISRLKVIELAEFLGKLESMPRD